MKKVLNGESRVGRAFHIRAFVATVFLGMISLGLQAATVYVSPDGKTEANGGQGTLANPYDLATGLSKAGSGGEVRFLMSASRYLLAGTINLDNIKCRGWNGSTDQPAGREGRDEVVIDGQNAVKCFNSNNLKGTFMVSDMTICRGEPATEGSLYKGLNVTGNSGFTNCVFTEAQCSQVFIKANGYTTSASHQLTFWDCDFVALTNTAFYGCFDVAGHTQFRGCNIINNVQTSPSNGYGGIGYGSANFYDCVISNNTAVGHGGFCMLASYWDNCLFENNRNANNGACVYVFGGTAGFNRCVFKDNRSTGTSGGGCISGGYIGGTQPGGNVFATNCVFVGNSAGVGNGGVVSVRSGKALSVETVEFVNCAFTNNFAKGLGGVSYVSALTNTVVQKFLDCDFYGNASTNSSGGVFSPCNSATLIVDGCTFTTNVAYSTGGVLYYGSGGSGERHTYHHVSNSVFHANSANSVPALYLNGEVVNCTFTSNRVTGTSGTWGPVYFHGYDQWNPTYYFTNRVEKCTFNGNEKPAIYANSWDLDVIDTAISNTLGQALYIAGVKNFLVDRCKIVGNQTTGQGAAIYQTSSACQKGIVRNTLFLRNTDAGNYSGGSSAVVQLGTNTYVESCTFVSNRCPTGLYGALTIQGQTNEIRVANTIFWENSSTYAMSSTYGQFGFDGRATMYWNCFDNYSYLPAANGNVLGTSGNRLDPTFSSPANDDYRIRRGSPCQDTGLQREWMTESSIDLAGESRLYGAAVDIGCYEYRPDVNLISTVICLR